MTTLVVPDKKGHKTPLGSLQDEIKHNYLVILTFIVGVCGGSLAFIPLELQYDAKTEIIMHSNLNTWLLVGIVVAALRLFDLGSYSAIFEHKIRNDFSEKITYFFFFSINLICLLVIMKLLGIYGSKYVDIVRCVVSCCQIVSIVCSLVRKNFVYIQSSLRPYLGISNLITALMFSIGDILYVLAVMYSKKEAFIVTAVFFATCIMIHSMLFIASFCELITEYQYFISVLRNKAGHLIYGFTTLCFFIVKLILLSESWNNSFSVGNDIYRNVILSIVYLIVLSCIPNGEIYSSYAHSSEELMSKNTFVRYISHEIRSPLSTVNLGIELLVQDIRKFSKNIRKRSKSPKNALRNPNISPSSDSSQSLIANSSSESIMLDDCSKCQDVIKQFDSISDILKDIQLSCEIATSTLNDLLSFDKIQSKMMHLEKRLMNAWYFVNESIRPYYVQAAAVNVQLIYNSAVNFSIDHLGILVDQFKLVQVIRNFLSNALKFSQRNATVIVNLRRLDSFSTTSNSSKRALYPGSKGVLRFEVIDHGVGVAKENQSKLFSQYVQLNAGKLQGGNGSGLGLWLSKAIIELHGGVIGMSSDGEGLGSCFYFEIPSFEYNHVTGRSASTINVHKQINFDLGYATRIVLGEHSDSANSVRSDDMKKTGKVRFKIDSEESSTSIRGVESPQQESRYVRVTSCDPMMNDPKADMGTSVQLPIFSNDNDTSNQRKATILIVDDTPLSRKMVERALSSIAEKILHAVDGENAIGLVSDQINSIDIILIDYYMPKMNGPDAVRAIRNMGFKGIVLGVTGSVADEDTRSFLHSGADKVLAKPLTLISFQEALNDLEVTRIDIQ